MPARQSFPTPEQDLTSSGRAGELPAVAARGVQTICRITGNSTNYFISPYLAGIVHSLLEVEELVRLTHHAREGVVEEGHQLVDGTPLLHQP